MKQNNPHVTIIILNWNGLHDTIECLESVLKLDYDNFNIILVDNNSTDNSVACITDWATKNDYEQLSTKFRDLTYPLEKKPLEFEEITDSSEQQYKDLSLRNKGILLVKNSTNLGFAIANNRAITLGEQLFKSTYFFLLNNDTVISKNALKALIFAMEDNREIGALQSTIYHYDMPGKISNAGGKILFWGQTKYYKKIKPGELKKIAFIHGCAMCVRSEILKKIGKLTEDFFFGEEDFEFSMRLKKKGVLKMCSGNSHVYHKTGVSSNKLLKNPEKKVCLFAINRIVDMRKFYPYLIWRFWKILALIYFMFILNLRYGVGIKKASSIMARLNKYLDLLQDAKKETIDKIFAALPF